MVSTRFGYRLSLAALALVGFAAVHGCTTDDSGRIHSYLGNEPGKAGAATSPVSQAAPLPEGGLEVGLLVVTDTSAQDSAPPLSDKMSALLVDLVRESLERDLPIRVLTVLPRPEATSEAKAVDAMELGRQHGVNDLVLAVHSSRDLESATYLGQGRMMTQMTGVTVENDALVEMALLDVQNERVMVLARGRGSETMDVLDTPIGTDQPSKEEARDILRINSGKKALDRAMADFDRGFGKAYSKR